MLARWATQIEFFPMTNSRHQLDTQQIRQVMDVLLGSGRLVSVAPLIATTQRRLAGAVIAQKSQNFDPRNYTADADRCAAAGSARRIARQRPDRPATTNVPCDLTKRRQGVNHTGGQVDFGADDNHYLAPCDNRGRGRVFCKVAYVAYGKEARGRTPKVNDQKHGRDRDACFSRVEQEQADATRQALKAPSCFLTRRQRTDFVCRHDPYDIGPDRVSTFSSLELPSNRL